MYTLNLLLRLFIAVCFIFIFFRIYNQENMNRTIVHKLVFFSHVLFLGLYLLNLISLPYFLFDVILWSIAGVGVICCVNLFKNKTFILFLLVPTTIVLLLLIPPMLLLDSM